MSLVYSEKLKNKKEYTLIVRHLVNIVRLWTCIKKALWLWRLSYWRNRTHKSLGSASLFLFCMCMVHMHACMYVHVCEGTHVCRCTCTCVLMGMESQGWSRELSSLLSTLLRAGCISQLNLKAVHIALPANQYAPGTASAFWVLESQRRAMHNQHLHGLWGSKLQSLRLCGKHFINWAISQLGPASW